MTDYSRIKWHEGMVDNAEDYYQMCLSDPEKFPGVEDLSHYLGVNDDTIVEWCKQDNKTAFKAVVNRIKSLQANRLQSLGLRGKYNPTMAIFLLKVNHGKIETNRQELTGKDGDAIATQTSVTYMPEPLSDDYYIANRTNNPN